MADETTTDSGSTTEATSPPAVPAPAPAPVETPAPTPTEPTSTTEQQPSSSDEGTTLLTGGEPAKSEDQGDPEPNPLFGAPEGDYEISGLPEGTVIDTDALAALTPVAKELGLSNEGASKLAGIYAAQLPRITEAVTKDILDGAAAQRAEWGREAVEAVKSDPAFGGAALKDVQAASAKAIERFGGQDLRTYLEETGLGNHPAMVKAFYLAGSAISEDTSFERGGNAPKPKTREEKYYPTT